jgi:hypothetical protein
MDMQDPPDLSGLRVTGVPWEIQVSKARPWLALPVLPAVPAQGVNKVIADGPVLKAVPQPASPETLALSALKAIEV